MRSLMTLVFFILSIHHSPSNNFYYGDEIDSQPNKLKMLTWNVQMLPSIGSFFSKDLRKMQKERTEWIVEHLQHSDFDIVLLQECFEIYFVEEIAKKLSQTYPYQVLPYKPKWYKLSNGLMILSKKPIDIVGNITYSNSAQSDFFASKGAVLVKYKTDDDSFFIVNTHLQADYENKNYAHIRNTQLEQIREYLLRPYTDSSSQIMIAGDLNVEENVESVEYKELIKKMCLRDMVYDFFKKPTASFDKNNYWNREYKNSCRLDYYLTNFRKNNARFAIEKPKKQLGNIEIDLADHYGISMELDM